MLSLLANITKLSDSFIQSCFHKFWATPILMHVSSVYTFCLVAICVCMYFNRRHNLIYKVLNLAVLSVFVVALWSYLTDVTFIYVVYILTFVSAVVMLFLSVVLMLPSSAVAVPKKASSYFICALFIDTTGIFYMLSIAVAFFTVYVAFATYSVSKAPIQSKHHASSISLISADAKNGDASQAKALAESFTYILDEFQDKPAFSEEPETTGLNTNDILSLDKYDGAYPVYLGALPKVLSKYEFLQNLYLQTMLQPMYELIVSVLAIKAVKSLLPRRLLKLVASERVKLFSILTQHNIVIYLNGDRAKKVILTLRRPWWSPFAVVAKLHHHIQQVTKLAHFNISVEGGYVGVVNMFLIKPLQSIFRLFTNSIFGVVSSRARLNSLLSFVTSRVAGMPSAVMETIAQIAAAWSIFLIALPSSQFNNYRHNFSASPAGYGSASSNLENLAYIQYELYVGSPLLMLVCVVGLLVALIGAALLVSTKVLNSK